jgi:hypothetical protein
MAWFPENEYSVEMRNCPLPPMSWFRLLSSPLFSLSLLKKNSPTPRDRLDRPKPYPLASFLPSTLYLPSLAALGGCALLAAAKEGKRPGRQAAEAASSGRGDGESGAAAVEVSKVVVPATEFILRNRELPKDLSTSNVVTVNRSLETYPRRPNAGIMLPYKR